MKPDHTRSILALIIGLSIAAIVLLSSCTIQRANKVQTLEMNNRLESYYETVWNKENNYPCERAAARKEIRNYLRIIK